MPNLGGWHFVIILVIILLLFGAPRLPKLARSLGESMRIFRGEVRTMNDEAKNAATTDAPASGSTPTGNDDAASATSQQNPDDDPATGNGSR